MEQNKKLKRVKVITKIAEIGLRICEIILLIVTIAALVLGITFTVMGNEVIVEKDAIYLKSNTGVSVNVPEDNKNSEDNGYLSVETYVAGTRVKLADIDTEKIADVFWENSESDIPYIQNMIDQKNYVGVIGFVMIFYSFALAIATTGVIFFRRIFTMIRKEETPFSKGVIKQMRISFIILSVGIFLTMGSLVGIFVVVGLWSIYCIFDYGYCLQALEDEII